MRVLSLEISNILSIENASLSFEDNGLILVEGWNYDTGRANGAGKTAIFNCLSFALYDKLPRKVTASEIVKRGAKTGSVKCSVLCSEDIWTVQRLRPKGVKFFKNGVEQSITQSEFESIIRLSYDQFLLTVYTAQANAGSAPRFLNSADADKKNFLLKLLNLEQFADCKKVIDANITLINASVSDLNSKLDAIKSKVDAYRESLVNTEEITSQKDLLNTSITALKQQLIEVSQVAKPDLSKYSKLEEDIRNKQAELAQVKAKRSMLYEKYRSLSNTKLKTPDEFCSECGTALDNAAALLAHKKHEDKVKEELIDLKSQIDECDILLSKETSVSDLARKLRDKKQQESVDYQRGVDTASELNSLLRMKSVQLDNLTSRLDNNQELVNKIDSLNTNLVKGASILSDKKADLELQKTLVSIYSPTGAQAYVLDSVVDSFNESVQKHIDVVWPHASYILNSYKETSKGDVVAKFSETLSLDGNEVSVGSLSGGEAKALSLCVDFALLDVLETQFGLSLNPFILDEPFDGLDSVGREMVMELLEKLAQNRQILVIDHTSEVKALFTKTIRVEKKAGTSSISIES